ncbi:formimidoylglutamase [Bacillus coahuilensis m2-6]|uniref:formimidoylglutamase n=1 Tax=Bacillus coahuilensis TaxID=408580 RepID=UPI00075026DC|nr:formimidoylglutamase [Bacillus coahuilensis]KUP09684.1 formimidoylglutamase [Bacillus coahuilensis m2-6]
MSKSFLRKAGKAVFIDRDMVKAHELLSDGEGVVGLMGLPLSKTSISHSGAHLSPTTIRGVLASYSTYAVSTDHDLKDERILDVGDVWMHPTDLNESRNRIRRSVEETIERFPDRPMIYLGGDHGISYPIISGWKNSKGRIGVIQFDAHHDLRNVEDGGRTNGTPFRSLLEDGIMEGKHLIQIGIRDYSNSRANTEYGRSQGVTIYTMDDVLIQGITSIMKKSLDYLQKAVDVIYVSVDVDVLDQAYAPGCPAIGPGGMTSRELILGVKEAASYEKVRAMDIVEIDPTVDFRDMTSRIGAHLVLRFLEGKAKRH